MARWGRGPNRAFGHVHNWQLSFTGFETITRNEKGWYGMYARRVWECVRGGKVVHTSPSVEYPAINYDYDGKPFMLDERIFVALSGSPYVVEDPY